MKMVEPAGYAPASAACKAAVLLLNEGPLSVRIPGVGRFEATPGILRETVAGAVKRLLEACWPPCIHEKKMARRLRAARSGLGFGLPAAQAGARRVDENGAASRNRTGVFGLAYRSPAAER